MEVHCQLTEERAIQADVDIFSGLYISANILTFMFPIVPNNSRYFLLNLSPNCKPIGELDKFCFSVVSRLFFSLYVCNFYNLQTTYSLFN
jgi:hypothetical protein